MIDRRQQDVIRDEYAQHISQLILGPGSENISENQNIEIISENPVTRYITGILYSKKEDDKDPIEPDMNNFEVDNGFAPHSMGLTFYCDYMDNPVLEYTVSGATYKKIDKELETKLSDQLANELNQLQDLKKIPCIDIVDNQLKIQEENFSSIKKELKTFIKENKKLLDQFKNAQKFISKLTRKLYQREPFQKNFYIDLSESGNTSNSANIGNANIGLFTKVQPSKNSDAKIVTIVVENKGEADLFQTVIDIQAQDNISFMSAEDQKSINLANIDDEDASNEMLYRQKKTYAVGRGVSVQWDESGYIARIYTTYIPSYSIAPMSFEIDGIDDDVLKTSNYIGDDHIRQLEKLNRFIAAYDSWIDKLCTKLAQLDSKYQKYARENILKCQECSLRMKKTVKLLQTDKIAFKSFNIANEAILLQRISDLNKKTLAYENHDYNDLEFSWRPFQLAFILNSLESILNKDSEERDQLDLLWVTTGGGKTEAYLFAIAATICYRRMSYENDNNSGVTVIMRYTLRLLTSQQFERASKLICALEYIRQKTQLLLGTEPISIGKWIGGGTENKRSDAKKDFEKMLKSNSEQSNVFQVLKCPWCQTSLIPEAKQREHQDIWGYKPIRRKGTLEMKCVNHNCPFNDGLPIYVVDEDIYQVRPTLILGTVDKFAQVPLKEATRSLFGSDNPESVQRPELIIQDEFHLISGPLGSLVGLYEAGFDYIFSHGNNHKKPKYIASTATIRNAESQSEGVFNRKVAQFPPSGLDSNDSFFIKDDPKGLGRKYYGLMATGTSQLTSEVRLIACLLQVTKNLGLSNDEEELLWTVTGYFNSLRELGKASNLINDDVQDYLKEISDRNGYEQRQASNHAELTSRIDGSQITQKLDDLSLKHNSENQQQAIDTLIATSMLSVGIDVDRMNVMYVVGQPKLTSEYIQATSRVGRRDLGSIWAIYNSGRSRDRSHYETFQSYHQNLYKYVEATSVTPYSEPALNKAVAAVIVAMLRNTVPDLSGDEDAGNILKHLNQLEDAKNYLLNRIENSEDGVELYYEKAKEILNDFCDRWQELANDCVVNTSKKLVYFRYAMSKSKNDQVEQVLLRGFEDHRAARQSAVPVMQTMRNVEEPAKVRVVDEG